MKNFGFIKTAVATPIVTVASPSKNAQEIKKIIVKAQDAGAKVLLTPELSISAYTCGDLFFQNQLINACETAVMDLCQFSEGRDILIVVGAPVKYMDKLFNCAVVIKDGEILGIVPKTTLSDHEKRWFTPYDEDIDEEIDFCKEQVPFGNLLFDLGHGAVAGIEISEDLWNPVAQSSILCLSGANVILNPSARHELVETSKRRRSLVINQSFRCICAYLYAGAGVYESTTDYVFAGDSIIAQQGHILAVSERFSRENSITYAVIDVEKINTSRRKSAPFDDNAETYGDYFEKIDAKVGPSKINKEDLEVPQNPFVPSCPEEIRSRCEDIVAIQSSALAKRLTHTGMKKCILGVSGGLDSTLALLVAERTMVLLGLPASNIIAVTMPGFGTTGRTYNNALSLINSIGAQALEVNIKDACLQHFKDIGHDANIKDITYENTQARERTQILMDIANKEGALLVGTGDLSELALGWCTYNGDHMSMYGVNAGIPKTLIYHIVKHIAETKDEQTKTILYDVLDTPVSPELLPPDEKGQIKQKTEDSVGPYELHDFFLYYYIKHGFTAEKIAFLAKAAFGDKYSDEEIEKWQKVFLKRFTISQFKRSCSPDAPKIGSVGLSPRGDLCMPSDASFDIWF